MFGRAPANRQNVIPGGATARKGQWVEGGGCKGGRAAVMPRCCVFKGTVKLNLFLFFNLKMDRTKWDVNLFWF
jgi:hypothetical protein